MAPGRGRGGFVSGSGPSTRANPKSEDFDMEDTTHISQDARATRTPAPAMGFDYADMASAFRACRQMEEMEASAARAVPTAAEVAAEQEEKKTERWLELSERIVKVFPREFLGTEGAIAAQLWIQEIDRHLEVLRCTPAERIGLAVYRLSGDARSWWDSCIRHYGRQRLYDSTWDEFCLLFERKFVPAYEKARLKEKYENLVQGSLTVEQYYREFDYLSYYASTESELDRVHRFKKGFHPSLRHKVGHLQFDTVLDVVVCASEAESVNISLRSTSDLGKRKFDAMSRPTSTVVPSGFTRPSQITSPAGGSSYPGAGSESFHGSCCNCGIRGHVRAYCRKFGGGAYVPAAPRRHTGGTPGQYQQPYLQRSQQQPARPAVRPPGQQLVNAPQNPQPMNQTALAAATKLAGGRVFALHGEPDDQDVDDGQYQPMLEYLYSAQYDQDRQDGLCFIEDEVEGARAEDVYSPHSLERLLDL